MITNSLCFALISMGILGLVLSANFVVSCVNTTRENLTEYNNTLLSFNSTDIMTELDDFIFSTFENYTRLNVGVYNQFTDITPAQETQISKDVSELVIVCMSPDLRNKIGMVYADDMINEIITKHVMVFTTTFVLESKK